jgi:hypothetical protein
MPFADPSHRKMSFDVNRQLDNISLYVGNHPTASTSCGAMVTHVGGRHDADHLQRLSTRGPLGRSEGHPNILRIALSAWAARSPATASRRSWCGAKIKVVNNRQNDGNPHSPVAVKTD